ncbi:zinc finger BED domain-containing protein 4-like [Hydra vulgaris]|uniref:Zinc finger BED domain-containing protein 4-like n=1 Tax=Hydra vulgaris TaxID=6087 RepID=A0ABM4C031_HYDVU
MSFKSTVWKYFEVSKKDIRFCICLLCKAILSRGGYCPKTFTTSVIRRHLKKKHLVEYVLIEIESDKKKIIETSTVSTSSDSEIKKQLTLVESINKKRLWNINDHRAIKIHNRIEEMMALDIQPYTIVDLGFRKLIKEICPNYQIPSRSYLSENIVPQIYDNLFNLIKSNISSASYISLTTDIWTANSSNVAFISMTAHWLNNEFSQHRSVLRVMHFPESQIGKNISESLHKGLLSFEIPHTKIHIVLRDNAANMVAGVRDSGFKSMPCFIHTIQLCIHDSILSQQSVKEILVCCRRLATHFHHSPTAAAKLEELQEQLGSNKHMLIQDVTTRWNSSYNMIERMLDQRVPLATYTADHATQSTLNSFLWRLLDKVFHILEPFKTLTVNLSEREAFLSDVIPSIMALKVFFNPALVCEAFLSINTLVEQLKESIDKRLSIFLHDKYLSFHFL